MPELDALPASGAHPQRLGEDGAVRPRVAWITALNERHLLRMRREDLSLVLTYDTSSREGVAELRGVATLMQTAAIAWPRLEPAVALALNVA